MPPYFISVFHFRHQGKCVQDHEGVGIRFGLFDPDMEYTFSSLTIILNAKL